MKKFTVIVLTAVALLQSAWSFAGDKTTASIAKPSSFVPHPRASNHVYGAPMQPAILGHAKTSRHKSTPKKQPSSTAHRNP
jgi:hypothetical protein